MVDTAIKPLGMPNALTLGTVYDAFGNPRPAGYFTPPLPAALAPVPGAAQLLNRNAQALGLPGSPLGTVSPIQSQRILQAQAAPGYVPGAAQLLNRNAQALGLPGSPLGTVSPNTTQLAIQRSMQETVNNPVTLGRGPMVRAPSIPNVSNLSSGGGNMAIAPIIASMAPGLMGLGSQILGAVTGTTPGVGAGSLMGGQIVAQGRGYIVVQTSTGKRVTIQRKRRAHRRSRGGGGFNINQLMKYHMMKSMLK